MKARRSKLKIHKRYCRHSVAKFLAWIIIVVITIGCLYARQYTIEKNVPLIKERDRLKSELLSERKRAEDLRQKSIYMQSDEYALELARQKLGMVGKDDILFTE